MTIDEVITMLNSEDCKLTTDICLMRYKVRDCWKCILKEYTKTVYNNAIDDFATKICEILEEYQTGFNMVSMANIWHFSRELAEQLKAGATND